MTGDFQSAIDYFQQSLEIAHKLKDSYGGTVCYDGLGACCNEMADFQRALNYFHYSAGFFRDLNLKRNEGIACLNIGIAYDCLNNRTEAASFIEKSLDIA